MRGKELLSEEERLTLISIPSDISDREIGIHYTLSATDIEFIKQHRRDPNRLGVAVQLSVLRYPGWSLSNTKEIPNRVLVYIAKQIQVRPEEFALYAQREATRKEHLEEIRQLYGYRNFTIREYRNLSQFILEAAMENGKTDYLIHLAIDELRKQRIILPAMTTIERFVWESRR